jgi:hypothetical protein
MRQVNGQNAFDNVELINLAEADYTPKGDVVYKIHVTTAGAIKVDTPKVTAYTLANVPVGYLELVVKKIYKVGTTAVLGDAFS